MKRLTGWLIGLLLLGGVGGAIYFYTRGQKKPEVHYDTTKVERGRLVAKVTATGTLSALVTVQVGSQVSGRLTQINVDFNSAVKKNQVIARLDPQLFQATLEQTRANLVAAQANVTKAKVQAVDAKRQFDRSRELAERKLIAVADRDTAQANFDAAEAQVAAASGTVEQARAAMHQAQINIDFTTIISPINGTVISRNVDVGQTVAASLQSPTLFTIAEDLRKMQVDTSVAEADVGKLHTDMPATFTVDAYPTEKFKGVIRQVRNAPQMVQNVVTYDAVIDVDNGELKLKPGMTANVTFVHAERDKVLKVPNAAMRFRPSANLLGGAASGGGRDGGTGHGGNGGGGGGEHAGGGRSGKKDEDPTQRKVFVLRDNKPVQIILHVGVTDGTFTEAVDGDLKEGDLVITDASGGDGKKDAPPPGMQRRMF